MIYSRYSIDEITSPLYEKVAQKIISLAKDEDTRKKMERNII